MGSGNVWNTNTQYVTDAERAAWNAKASTDPVTETSNGLMLSTDKIKLDHMAEGSFVYNQITSSSTWSITHNLNKYPSVNIVDSGGNCVIGDIQYINLNQIQITFTAQFSGKAYLN